MLIKHAIQLPENISQQWTDEQITAMAEVAYNLPHMWNHAVGMDWKQKISIKTIKGLYKRL